MQELIGKDARGGEVGVVFALVLDTCGKKCCVGIFWLVRVVVVGAEGGESIRDVWNFDGSGEERVGLNVEE